MRLPRFALAIILTAIASPALASSIVVPNGFANTVGNSPDSTELGLLPPIRAQELYGSGQFVSVGGALLIDQFAFRVTPGSGAFHTEMANLDLYMSTSQRFPNLSGGAAGLMSTTFADNLGPDNTLVYHGPVSWVSPGCPVNGSTPCAFDLLVTLQTPFYYNPSQGRLLLDLFITGLNGLAPGATDGVDFGDTPTGPIYGSVAGMVGLQGNAVASDFDNSGDITQFRYTAVPEPATMALLLTGLGAGAVARRRRG